MHTMIIITLNMSTVYAVCVKWNAYPPPPIQN